MAKLVPSWQLLGGLGGDARFPQRIPQEIQHRIVAPLEVEFNDLLPGQADGGAEFVMGPQKGIHAWMC